MKKLMSTLLAGVLLVGCLSACGKETPVADSKDAGESVTLKIAHNMDYVTIPDSVIAAAKRLEKRYAAEGRNITINFEKDYQRIDWGEYHNNLIFSEKSGTGPDIFHLSGDVYGLVNAGMLMDISEVVSDSFADGIFDTVTVNNVVYGMPFDMPVHVMFYNKTCLEKIGWTKDQIEALPQQIRNGGFTFEEFIALAAEVQEKGAAVWGLSHRPGAGSDFNNILRVLGVETYDENGTLVFDEEGVTRFFQFTYDNSNVLEITPHDLNQMGWGTVNEMVANGDAFSYYGPLYSFTYVAESVGKSGEELVNDIGFALFPVSGYNDTPFSLVYPQSMGINANTKYPEICLDLFKELANGSADLLAGHASKIFALSSVKAANAMPVITDNYLLKGVAYMADYGVSPRPCHGDELYMSELHKQILLLELGQTTPEQAAADFKTQMELNLSADDIVFK